MSDEATKTEESTDVVVEYDGSAGNTVVNPYGTWNRKHTDGEQSRIKTVHASDLAALGGMFVPVKGAKATSKPKKSAKKK